eukprot:scaffold61822_cov52-Attheya_sp.AAC.7
MPPSLEHRYTLSLVDSSADTHNFIDPVSVRVPKEIGCALAASLLISPLVSIVDKTMMQPLKGVGSFMKAVAQSSAKMASHPREFFGSMPFRLTVLVYFGTYAVANVSEVALDEYRVPDELQRKKVKVGAASLANVSLLMWRDAKFAREFSSIGAKFFKPTPIRTLALFGVRDMTTMVATFYGAPEAAKYLYKEHHFNQEFAEISTALTIPVLSQFLTAPLHVYAMDYFNRQRARPAERLALVSSQYGKVALARGLRILPAFGLGSYSNNKFREAFIKQPLLETVQEKIIRRATIAVSKFGRNGTVDK